MKKSVVIFFLLMTTSSLIYCQETYPQKRIIDNDTVVLITADQVKDINMTFLELREEKEINSALCDKISQDSVLVVKQNELNDEYRKQIEIQKQIINNNQEARKSLDLQLKKEKRNKIIAGTSCTIAGIIIGIITGLLIAK